jgi:hypothetical protein
MPKIPLYESSSRIGTAKGVTLNPNVAVRYAEAVSADDSALTLGLFNLVEETLGAGKEFIEKREKEKQIGDAHKVDLYNLQLDDTYQKITEEYLKTNTRLDDNFFKTYLPQESNNYFTQFIKDKDITLTPEIQQSYDISSTNQYKTLIAATETREANERKASGIKLATNRANKGQTEEALEVLEQVKDSFNPVEFENQRQSIMKLSNSAIEKQQDKQKELEKKDDFAKARTSIFENPENATKQLTSQLYNQETFYPMLEPSDLKMLITESKNRRKENVTDVLNNTYLSENWDTSSATEKIANLQTLYDNNQIDKDTFVKVKTDIQDDPLLTVDELKLIGQAREDLASGKSYDEVYTEYFPQLKSEESKKQLASIVKQDTDPDSALERRDYLLTQKLYREKISKLVTDKELLYDNTKIGQALKEITIRFNPFLSPEEREKTLSENLATYTISEEILSGLKKDDVDQMILDFNMAAGVEFDNRFEIWMINNRDATVTEIREQAELILDEIKEEFAQGNIEEIAEVYNYINSEKQRALNENQESTIDAMNIDSTEENLPEDITQDEYNKAKDYFKSKNITATNEEIIQAIRNFKNK